jgi:hypothetical protein
MNEEPITNNLRRLSGLRSSILYFKHVFGLINFIWPVFSVLIVVIVLLGLITGIIEGWNIGDSFYYAFITAISDQNSLGEIFSYKSLFWSAGPGFNWNILNYGRIRNSVRVEDARLQQLLVSYKDTVLNAQREVEDAIVAFTRSKEEERFLKDSVTAAQRAVEISMLQYREGLVDYQRVLDSQRFLVTQADRMTEVSGQVGTNLVATYKALGGGWQIRNGEKILSAENRNEMIERTSWGGLLDTEELALPVDHNDRRDWQWPDW